MGVVAGTPCRHRTASRDSHAVTVQGEAVMAWAKILHTWPDGSTDELEVGTETGYPDALAELVARQQDGE